MSIEEVPAAKIRAVHKFLKSKEVAYYKLNNILDDKKLIGVYTTDSKGKTIGGMTGFTKWKTLHLKYFYLDESLRYQGMGLKMLRRLIEIAKSRGVKYAVFNTLDIGAPSLFKAAGCKLITMMDHTPADHVWYIYRLTL